MADVIPGIYQKQQQQPWYHPEKMVAIPRCMTHWGHRRSRATEGTVYCFRQGTIRQIQQVQEGLIIHFPGCFLSHNQQLGLIRIHLYSILIVVLRSSSQSFPRWCDHNKARPHLPRPPAGCPLPSAPRPQKHPWVDGLGPLDRLRIPKGDQIHIVQNAELLPCSSVRKSRGSPSG